VESAVCHLTPPALILLISPRLFLPILRKLLLCFKKLYQIIFIIIVIKYHAVKTYGGVDRVASDVLQPPTWGVPILVAFYDMHGLQWDYSFPRSPRRESGSIAPHIINLGATSVRFTPGKRAHGTHWIGGFCLFTSILEF
jgi:hypothetical protein